MFGLGVEQERRGGSEGHQGVALAGVWQDFNHSCDVNANSGVIASAAPATLAALKSALNRLNVAFIHACGGDAVLVGK